MANFLNIDCHILLSYLSSLPATALAYLEKQLDWDHEGVDQHLNEIADIMIDWEEKLSTFLGLTEVQIHDLKEKYSQKPVLQRYYVILNPIARQSRIKSLLLASQESSLEAVEGSTRSLCHLQELAEAVL